MTEFRRATNAVDTVEKLLNELVGIPDEGATPSAETRSKFMELEKQFSETAPIAEKMRRRCEARAELELLKGELRAQLPGAPEEPVKVIQDAVDANEPVAEFLQRGLEKALELEGNATYGVKMAEKVCELLVKLDTVKARFDADIIPRFAGAVANADAADAAKKAKLDHEASLAAAAAQKQAEEEYRQATNAIAAESSQKMREQKEAEEEAERVLAVEAEAKRQEDLAQAIEDELLQRQEVEGEQRLAAIGPDAACAEALVSMLASAVGKYRETVEALHGILGGIASEPADPSIRLLRVAHERFQQQLGRKQGVWLFLRGVGFEPRTRETLPNGLAASLGLSLGSPGERFFWLQEPDMMADYANWLPWHERIKFIAGFAQNLERLAFQRTAHLGKHGLDVSAQTVLSEKEVLQRWEARAGS